MDFTHDPMFMFMSLITMIVYFSEMYIAYLWSIKSFDVKWWVFQILWLMILLSYQFGAYMLYKDNNRKYAHIIIFITALLFTFVWVINFSYKSNKDTRLYGGLLIPIISSYHIIINKDINKHVYLILPMIIFTFIGSSAFGMFDIGEYNVKYSDNV
jgi:hypothetical protein